MCFFENFHQSCNLKNSEENIEFFLVEKNPRFFFKIIFLNYHPRPETYPKMSSQLFLSAENEPVKEDKELADFQVPD